MENTIIVAAPADEAAPIKFIAPYAGCAMGEHFLYNGKARALRLRRPHQTRLRLPPDVAAAAAPAGPRGLPGRRLLPALAAARAGGETERRARRRLADGAADHRDPGLRRLRLHPDQRDLDHRRPDLPRVRPLQLGRAAGDQRRHLGLAGGRQRADQGDEEGRRQAAPRPLPVPRPRGLRPVRLRARPGDPENAEPRRTAGRDAQAERARAARGRRPGRLDLLRHRRLPRPDQDRAGRRVPRATCGSGCAPRRPDLLDRIAETGKLEEADEEELGKAIAEFVDDFGPDFDEQGDPLEAGESDRIKSEEERARPSRVEEAEADENEEEKEAAPA